MANDQMRDIPEESSTLLLKKNRQKKELESFFTAYITACSAGKIQESELAKAKKTFTTFIRCVEAHTLNPYQFQPYHVAEKEPFDFQQLGLDFVRPLIDFSSSTLDGKDSLASIVSAIKNKENVILLANHQTEIDPQILSLMLEKEAPEIAKEMVFVAGHRVVQDPLATPMSAGCNLLCIYSKKYIDHPPEKKAEKLAHNRRTLKEMEELLKKGGVCIYVAPSGGRDRLDEEGKLYPAAFDADSIEMFYLIAKKAGKKTHFHPLSLFTYPLLPPPKTIHVELGEERVVNFSPVHISFGEEIMMDAQDRELCDKHEIRKKRAESIWQAVCAAYTHFPIREYL